MDAVYTYWKLYYSYALAYDNLFYRQYCNDKEHMHESSSGTVSNQNCLIQYLPIEEHGFSDGYGLCQSFPSIDHDTGNTFCKPQPWVPIFRYE